MVSYQILSHYATYVEFVGNSLSKRRVTKYCYDLEDCHEFKDKPYFKFRNKSVRLQYDHWLKQKQKLKERYERIHK